MSDATLNPVPPGIFPAGTQAKDKTVSLEGVDSTLLSFLTVAGLVHIHLFDSVLVVASARDAIHGKGSKHYVGKALDLRITDLRPEWQPIFIMVLYVLAYRFKLAVFDESNLPGGPHVHVEIAG